MRQPKTAGPWSAPLASFELPAYQMLGNFDTATFNPDCVKMSSPAFDRSCRCSMPPSSTALVV